MVRFFLSFTLIIVLSFGAVWFWVLTQPTHYFDMNYGLWKSKIDLVEQCHPPTLVVFGDSKTLSSVIPSELGTGVLNLAVGSNNIFDGLLQSRYLLSSCALGPKAVILSYAFLNFANTDLWYSIRYGHYDLSLADMEQLRRQSRTAESPIYGKITPWDVDARLKNFLYWIQWPPIYFSSLVHSIGNNRVEENRKYYQQLMASHGYFALPHTPHANRHLDEWAAQQHFDVAPLQLQFMDELLDRYARRHIPVYYVSPAYSAVDMKILNPQVKSDFHAYLINMEKKHPNFHTLGPEFSSLPDMYFGDDLHVTPEGAELWTKKFKRILDDAGIVY